jgi:hypothetical protein
MGNHEFCTRCGQNDFHYGESCEDAYPEQLKEYQQHQNKPCGSCGVLASDNHTYDCPEAQD